MSDKLPDFDAADLAEAILGDTAAETASTKTAPTKTAPTKTAPTKTALPAAAPNYLGPILMMLLGLAVTLGIGLALQYNNDRATPQPIRCTDLYASVSDDCCDKDWVENWAPCRLDCEPEPHRDPDSGGLFDAEEQFARDPGEC